MNDIVKYMYYNRPIVRLRDSQVDAALSQLPLRGRDTCTV